MGNLTYDHLKAMLSSMGDGVIATNIKGNIIYINPSAEELTGWNNSLAEGRYFDEVFRLINPITQQPVTSPIKQVLEEEKTVGLENHSALVKRNGDIRYASASCSPIRTPNGGLIGAIVVFRDIHRIKQMEEQIRVERNNLQQTFESMPIGMILVDRNLEIKQVNNSFLDVFDYNLSDIIGKPFGEGIRCVNSFSNGCGKGPKCSLCHIRNALINILTTGEPCNNIVEQLTLDIDGKQIKLWYKINFVLVVFEGEDHIIVVMDDVTDERKTTQVLLKARDKAQAANRAKSEFLANMSHEIRTPINGIVGMIDLTLLTDLDEEQKENLKIAKSCANSLLNIINDILDFSKLEAGKMTIENIGFDIKGLIEETVKTHTPYANNKNLDLNYTFSCNIPQFLNGDPNRLQQVINNLLSNAIKFTDEGEVSLSVKKVMDKKDMIELKFAVADTGIGVSEEETKNLFKTFSQVDSSITRKYGGTGLGLAISRQLIETMGGKMWVESKKGKGSTFFFTVPFRIGTKPIKKPITTREVKKTEQTLNILLVEDDLVNQEVINRMLKEKGHKVDLVSNGVEALKFFENKQYDIILMDIQMPELDGIETTKRIRDKEIERGERTPIIALTAYALHGDRERFLSLGMDEYLAKPIRMEELFNAINKTWEESKQGASFSVSGIMVNEYGEIVFQEKSNNVLLSNNLHILNEIDESIKHLSNVLADGDFSVIEDKAHKIKNHLNKIDAEELKSTAFKIELAARRGNLQEVIQRTIQLNHEYETYKNSIG